MEDILGQIQKGVLKGDTKYVIDLGIDVTKERFAEEVVNYKPNVLALSALLTTTISRVEERGEGTFGSWSIQTDRVYSGSQLAELLVQLDDPKRCGKVIRAKEILKTTKGGVLLDYVPEHGKIRSIRSRKKDLTKPL